MLRVFSLLSGLMVTGGIAALALTNPTLEDYGTYAGEALAAYAEQEYCAQIPTFLESLIHSCQALVRELQPELKALFMRQTHRQNFILFSLYTTDLSLLDLGPLGGSLPTHHFETLGVAGRFYTYEIRQGNAAP